MMLELFKGTGSVGDVFEANGYTVVSVDNLPRWKPTFCVDVLRWDYRADLRPGDFEFCWASPPCTEYSIALSTRPRNIALANRIVRRALEIIAYVRPRFWFMENPATGFLRHQPMVRELPFIDVDYCRFSNWGYRKRTRIWYGGFPRPPTHLTDQLCPGMGRCPNMLRDGTNRHRIQLSSHDGLPMAGRSKKYRVPARLVRYLTGLSRLPRKSSHKHTPELPRQ